MKKIKISVDEKDPTMNTQSILTQILKVSEQGRTVAQMVEVLDIVDKIQEAKPEDGIVLKDSEYDTVKSVFENHKFPHAHKFFLLMQKDIKDYESIPNPPKVTEKEDAKQKT